MSPPKPLRRLQHLVDLGPHAPAGETGAKFIIRKDGRRINLAYIRDDASRALEVCGESVCVACVAWSQTACTLYRRHHLLLLHLEQLASEKVPVGSMLPQRFLVGDGVAAFFNEKLELLLVEPHFVGEDELRLHTRLDDVPEGLDRVELW